MGVGSYCDMRLIVCWSSDLFCVLLKVVKGVVSREVVR